MHKFSEFVCKHRVLIVIAALVLLIPATLGYFATKINYDLLVYLPSEIETLKGQEVLTEEFGLGAFAVAVVEDMPSKNLLALEEDFRSVEGVRDVLTLSDLTGTTLPLEFLPSEVREKAFAEDGSQMMMITFRQGTSDEQTLDAVAEIRSKANQQCKLGGMSAMVLDTKTLFNSETLIYVLIAVGLSLLVLLLSLDSYLVPFLMIGSIGIALIFNMGTNVFLGEISYITKAISAVLQLGVTMDFSIFLYHKYEAAKKSRKNKLEAMAAAIEATATSVVGSALTTFAGFLALCTMSLTLGTDIGIVMAKGVVLGVICAITIFPAILLVCDGAIEKTKHRTILPQFTKVQNFIVKYRKVFLILFAILLIPVYLLQTKTEVYYKLDSSIPENYEYSEATTKLREDFGMESQMIILAKKPVSSATASALMREIDAVEGVQAVLSPNLLEQYGLSQAILSESLQDTFETENYAATLVLSDYSIASDELNRQIDQINTIVKTYNTEAIVAGEGPLMKDLVEISNRDFINVNFVSIGVIFVIMALVLKSISLPVLLMVAIEFAIFLNLGISFLTSTPIPFIASIVIGTIQLGATIDYTILLTTKYLEQRRTGSKPVQAAKEALGHSLQSILVSAMCFFAATIGVGVISQIDMIGTLCTLIARGAIISMVVVVTVIPALLVAFDPLVIRTTLGMKEAKK